MPIDHVMQVIAACTRTVVPGLDDHQFAATDRLEELGAGSVDRAEVVTLVLEQLQLDIPRVATIGPANLGELAALLDAKLAAR